MIIQLASPVWRTRQCLVITDLRRVAIACSAWKPKDEIHELSDLGRIGISRAGESLGKSEHF